MTRMTEQEIIHLLALAAANHPHVQERDLAPTAELWHAMLRDENYETAKAGLLKVLAHSKHFPTVGEVLEGIAAVKPKHPLPEPEEAWQEVLRLVKNVGYMGTPTWSHEMVGKTAMALYGSWVQLCRNLTQENMTIDRAHYLRLYGQYKARDQENAAIPGSVRALIGKVAGKLALPEGGGGGASEV